MTIPFKVGDRAKIRLLENVYVEVQLTKYLPQSEEVEVDGFYFKIMSPGSIIKKGWAPTTHFEPL
jgi:hypothetical protein